MFKLLQTLLMGFGVPLIAQQINQDTQKVSKELLLVTFLIDQKKQILKTIILGVTGAIFTAIGISLCLFAMAQQIDLNSRLVFNISIGVSISILLCGVILGLLARSVVTSMNRAFIQANSVSFEKPSFLKTLIATFIQSFISGRAHSRHRPYVHSQDREDSNESRIWN